MISSHIPKALPICAYRATQMMAESTLQNPNHRSRQIARNPYVDDEVGKCNDLVK